MSKSSNSGNVDESETNYRFQSEPNNVANNHNILVNSIHQHSTHNNNISSVNGNIGGNTLIDDCNNNNSASNTTTVGGSKKVSCRPQCFIPGCLGAIALIVLFCVPIYYIFATIQNSFRRDGLYELPYETDELRIDIVNQTTVLHVRRYRCEYQFFVSFE